MQTTHRVAINTGILYARMAITVYLSLYTTRITLGALGTSDFGIFNVVSGTIIMLTFLNNSMTSATQRFMSFAQGQKNEVRQRNIFNVSIILHVIIALITLGLLEGTGKILFSNFLRIEPTRIHAAWLVYQFAIASTLFTIISVPYDAIINARENMLFFAILGVIEAILKLAIAFFIASAENDRLVIYSLLITALSIILFLLRVGYCHTHYQECQLSPKRYANQPLFKEMTSFAGWSFLGASTSMMANYGQGIVLNIFFGTPVNAAQGIANQVGGQVGAFAGTMLRALNPLIAKSEGAGKRELMLKASMIGSKMGFFLLMFFCIPILVEMPYLFKLWLTNIPEYTITFCRLLLLRNLIEQIFITLTTSISAVGNIKNYQIATSILTLFPLFISFLFFRAGFAPYTLYITFIIYSICTSFLIIYFANKACELSVRIFLQNVVLRCITAFLLTLTMSVSILLVLDPGLLRFVTIGLISTMAFFISVWWIGFCKEERFSIFSLTVATLKHLLVFLKSQSRSKNNITD